MKKLASTYKDHFQNRAVVQSLLFSILLLIFSAVASYYAGVYATLRESSPVTDIILSNTKAVNVTTLFIYGGLMLFAGIIVLSVMQPKRLPFTLKSVAVFFLIRSVFISLTHIGPFPGHAAIDVNNFTRYFNFDGDLFFSGHTGLPFLIALIYWDKKFFRYLFLFLSIFFGVVVLLGHLHYTIDVASAFFITYAIHDIAKFLFKPDYEFCHAIS